MIVFLTGRKEICEGLGASWSTVKRWVKLRGFPILQEDGWQPIVSIDAANRWEEERRKAIEGEK